MPLIDRTKCYRDEHGLLPVHYELMTFFKEPQEISLTDLAEALGYDRSVITIRLAELVAKRYIKKETFPHVWGKPNRYEAVN